MKPLVCKTREEFEKATAAMQEERNRAAEIFAKGWKAAYGDFSSTPFTVACDRYLNLHLPLPVLEEPSPTVKGPSGRSYRLEDDAAAPDEYVALRATRQDGTHLWNWLLDKSDLPAVVLALLGPEKLAEFYMMVREVSNDSPGCGRRAAILASYPKLVAQAGESR